MSPAPTLYGQGHQLRETGNRPVRPLRGGHLCLDYLNTVSTHDGRVGDDDLAPGYANVVDWFQQADLLTGEDADRLRRLASKEPRDAAAVRKRAVALREALYDIVLALTSGEEPSAAALHLFNTEFRDAQRHGQFVTEDAGLVWRWETGAHLDRLLWPICQSAADLLTGDRLGRVRQCQAATCQVLFLDSSRNGSRRFCSTAGCGTADRVRRFRERHKSPA